MNHINPHTTTATRNQKPIRHNLEFLFGDKSIHAGAKDETGKMLEISDIGYMSDKLEAYLGSISIKLLNQYKQRLVSGHSWKRNRDGWQVFEYF